jgi:hypothetical protein
MSALIRGAAKRGGFDPDGWGIGAIELDVQLTFSVNTFYDNRLQK